MDFPVEPRKRSMPEHPANIAALSAELSGDGRKVRVLVELDRDDTRPDLDLQITDAAGNELCHSTIIELFSGTINFTLHIRDISYSNPMILTCRLYYIDDKCQSEKAITIMDEKNDGIIDGKSKEVCSFLAPGVDRV